VENVRKLVFPVMSDESFEVYSYEELVAVKVANDRTVESAKDDDILLRSGLEIQLAKGTLRVFGTVDVVALRAAIECLVG
jgi:hypothetical protein